MRVRLQIAALVFVMVQSVMFGVGLLLILTTPLAEIAFLPIMATIAASIVISAIVAWFIAPRLRLRGRSGGTGRAYA